ncbi:hypothetical protein [Aquimarina agarivorans]|uniref:hypothetical protein n=1 Tax=Aquimarina agarivorans TaxID=980584 RepID=UPI00111001B0|nr:hypothetical protein [Aquimarina agarivorans]
MLFISCEEQEEDVTGITRSEITESDFLQFDQKNALIEILTNSTEETAWKITNALSGSINLTENFVDTRLRFTLLDNELLQIRVQETAQGLFNTGGSSDIVKDNINDDLRFPFVVNQTNAQTEKFSSINTATVSLGYRVLKTITANKITLLSANGNGEKLMVVFEKIQVITTPPLPPESDFLQISEQQNFMDALATNSLQDPWKITSANFGTNDLSQDFEQDIFVFETLNEGAQRTEIYDSSSFVNNPFTPATTGTNEFFKDENNNDLRFQMFIVNTQQQNKFQSINNFGNTGYKILKDASSTKFTIIGFNENGDQEATIIFQKQATLANDFVFINQLNLISDILMSNPNTPWKIIAFTSGNEDRSADFNFSEINFTSGQSEEFLTMQIFEPEDEQNQTQSLSTNGELRFSKDTDGLNLRISINVFGSASNGLQKYMQIENNNQLGYLAESSFTENNLTLVLTDPNGTDVKLVLGR